MWLLGAIGVAILGARRCTSPASIDLGRVDLPGAATSPGSRTSSAASLFGVGMTLGSGCGQQDADPHRRRQPEVGGGVRLARHRRLHDAARPVRRLPRGDASRSVAVDSRRRPGPAVAAAAGGRPARRQRADAASARWGSSSARRCSPMRSGLPRHRSFDFVVGGVVIGLVVVGGWYISGHLGYVAEDPQTLAGSLRRHQQRPHGVVLVRRAAGLHARDASCSGPTSRGLSLGIASAPA